MNSRRSNLARIGRRSPLSDKKLLFCHAQHAETGGALPGVN
jgi:hypothetical protein